MEYIEEPVTLSGAANAEIARPRPFETRQAARRRVSAGEAGEWAGRFLGRIGQRLSGMSTVARQTGQRTQPARPEQSRPAPGFGHGEQRLSRHSRDTRPGTLSADTLVPLKVTGDIQPGQATIVAEPRGKRSPSFSPIVRLSSGQASGACPIPGDGQKARPAAGSRTRKWILAAEVMEILAHVSPLRNVLRRVLGPRGADLLFLGTSLAGLLLPFHASGSVDVFALFMVAARFALGFLIEPWWIDLLFGLAGIATFLLERRRHRQALATG